jgi:tetratricopeptide (TPR) repeat protein
MGNGKKRRNSGSPQGRDFYMPAMVNFYRAIKLDPNNIFAYCGRGSVYMQMEDFDQAIANFSRAIAWAPAMPRYITIEALPGLKSGYTQCRRSRTA